MVIYAQLKHQIFIYVYTIKVLNESCGVIHKSTFGIQHPVQKTLLQRILCTELVGVKLVCTLAPQIP